MVIFPPTNKSSIREKSLLESVKVTFPSTTPLIVEVPESVFILPVWVTFPVRFSSAVSTVTVLADGPSDVIVVIVAKYRSPATVLALTPVISSVCARPKISVPVTVKVMDETSAPPVIAALAGLEKDTEPPLARLPSSVNAPAGIA